VGRNETVVLPVFLPRAALFIRVVATGSARAYIENLVAGGIDDEGIERRVLIDQRKLDWDLPAGRNPFLGDGIKKESDRIRLFVADYLAFIRNPATVGTYGVGVEAFTSSRADDSSLFSVDGLNVSAVEEKFVLAPSRLRGRPFEDVWSSVRALAHKLANERINCDGHLTVDDRHVLVQAGRIAVWEATRTWRGIESRFSTYAHRAISNAMKDASNELRPSGVVLDDESPRAPADDFADALCGWLDVLGCLESVCDGRLVLARALGVRDHELEGSNLRVRRHRAKLKIAELLFASDCPPAAVRS
jgi:hypothetical protein